MSEPESLSTRQLALLKGKELDIPKRTRWVIFIGALVGVGLVVMGSLFSGGQDGHIETDKIIHFSGYAILSFLLVVALRPLFFVPALLLLIGIGATVEILQGQTGRSTDIMDALANSIGVFVGASVGMVARFVFAWVRQELLEAGIQRNLVEVQPGQVVFREDEDTDNFWLVRAGKVELSRMRDGKLQPVDVAGPGELIGALGLILGKSNYVTATALEPTTLLTMDIDDLLPSEGTSVPPPAVLVSAHLADLVVNLALRLEAAGVPISDLDGDPTAGETAAG